MGWTSPTYHRDWCRRRDGYTPAERPCIVCGAAFLAKKRRDTVCTATACRVAKYRAYQRAYHHRQRGWTPTDQRCVVCQDPFTPKRRNDRTCTHACTMRLMNIRRTLKALPPDVREMRVALWQYHSVRRGHPIRRDAPSAETF